MAISFGRGAVSRTLQLPYERSVLQISGHNARMERKMWRHKITRAGQVSIPAEVRERWGTSTVLIVDEGERITLRPAPENLIEALTGILAGKERSDITADEAKRLWRAEDNAAMERKWREYYGE
jgi:AbrB family looped-hinge helix DNA binding protein